MDHTEEKKISNDLRWDLTTHLLRSMTQVTRLSYTRRTAKVVCPLWEIIVVTIHHTEVEVVTPVEIHLVLTVNWDIQPMHIDMMIVAMHG